MPDGPQPWTTFFDLGTVARAEAYADDGEVERVERVGDLIEATVHGHKTYRLRIVIEGLVADEVVGLLAEDVASDCSCPVGWRCKHAAAALIAYARQLGIPDCLDDELDRPGAGNSHDRNERQNGPVGPSLPVATPQHDAQAQALSAWLGQIAPRGGGGLGDMVLCWHLHAPAEHGGRWRAEPLLARRLKNGTLGVGKRFTDPFRAMIQLAPLLTSEEAALLRRLCSLRHPQHEYDSGWLDAACGAGGDLVEALVAGGRCYLGGFASGPMRLGGLRQAALTWREGRGGWRLALDAQVTSWIPTDPPWWVHGSEAGPLDLPIGPAALEAVRSMPAVPASMLPTVLPVLARIVPGLPDPPVAPTAIPPSGFLLRLRARVAPLGANLHAGFEADALAVWMRYGDVLVEIDSAPAARAPDGSTVVRDIPGERELLAQLSSLGLASDLELKLGRKQTMPRPGVPIYLHRASLHQAQRSGLGRVELPGAVVAAVRSLGWTVEGEGSEAPPDLAAEAIEVTVGEPGGIDWFELHLGVRIGDERIDLTPVIARLVAGGAAARSALPRLELDGRGWLLMAAPDGRLLRLPEVEVLRLAERIEELFDAQPAAGRGWKADAALALQLDELAGGGLRGERLSRLVEGLRRLAAPDELAEPPGLSAELRPYQRRGLGWMQRLRETGMGGVLADDMGLGKTVQAIAFLCAEQAAGRLDRPALVICPASVVGTWRRELERFAPGLTVAILHGAERERDAAALAAHHVLITTYGTLLRDQDLLAGVELHIVICDEAQVIKNSAAKAGAAVRRLHPRHRLALSGTPLENHLGELHTLMHWLVPGLLGDRARFQRIFRKPIEQEGDVGRAATLRRRVAPFILRRTKEQVAPELPPRTEAVVPLELTAVQRELYESVRLAMDRRIRDVLAAKGLARSRIDILDALLRLRQVCCDPRLVRGGGVKVGASAKLDWLSDTLPELVEDGRRILLFSQFTSLLDLVESDVLKPAGLAWLRLDGATRDRQDLVEQFQAGAAPVFLLSLKAGGTGLTLTAADTVILLDPWWNPAAESQAADRAHRIGQDKPVFIYRPICVGTVEERIQELQRRKRALADALWDGTGQAGGELTEDDLAELLAPLPA